MFAPADGPLDTPGLPPEAVVAVGRSVGLPANGSVAPVTVSPAAFGRALCAAVRAGGFDVLHLHEPLAPGPGYGWLVRCAQPKVGTFHRAGPSVAYRLLGPLARAAAGRLSARCAVSAEAADTARRALGGTYDIVGNGVELERFSGAPPWPTHGPTIVFVGRHEARKGLGVLLDAVNRLDPETPVTLWVTGEGPETPALRRRHPQSGRVIWLGRVDDDELASRLAGAHVLCAPSLGGESFGVVLLEAMAAGTAVVASDLPGYAAVMATARRARPPRRPRRVGPGPGPRGGGRRRGTGPSAPEALATARAHAAECSTANMARRYVDIYSRVLAAAPGPPPESVAADPEPTRALHFEGYVQPFRVHSLRLAPSSPFGVPAPWLGGRRIGSGVGPGRLRHRPGRGHARRRRTR